MESVKPQIDGVQSFKSKLDELYEWMQARKEQQISYPLDDISMQILVSSVIGLGAGSTALTQTYTDSRGDTVIAPKAYAGSRIIKINGTKYEFGYIAIPS